MTDVDPFASWTRPITEPDPAHAALRAAGPIARVVAPAGGSAWVVTDEELARTVFGDARIVKDPAWAPTSWDPMVAGLEPTAAEATSLTTAEGAPHAGLRRAHVPMLNARRTQDRSARIAAIARDLLTGVADAGPVDLTADFAMRFPLSVLLEVLGVQVDDLDRSVAACRGIHGADFGAAAGEFMGLAAAAVRAPDGLAVELRDRLPDGTTDDELQYLIFGLVFGGLLTTDTALGFVLAHALHGDRTVPADELVGEVLRTHPPAPFSLWRFTTTDVELAGTQLPARSPVLVDIAGINTAPGRPAGPDLVFGGGAHYCIGAQLARAELCAAVEVLRADFPDARLAVPFTELRHAQPGGVQGPRVTALPVRLRTARRASR